MSKLKPITTIAQLDDKISLLDSHLQYHSDTGQYCVFITETGTCIAMSPTLVGISEQLECLV